MGTQLRPFSIPTRHKHNNQETYSTKVGWWPSFNTHTQQKHEEKIEETVLTKLIPPAKYTFAQRGAKSELFGGLWGYGLDIGQESLDPFGGTTYMSSVTILSFCKPVQTPPNKQLKPLRKATKKTQIQSN